MNKAKFGVTLSFTMAFAGLIGGCKNAAQAEAGVFTTEQLICMVDGLMVGGLSGTAQVIASDIEATCPGLAALNNDVLNFINAFNNLDSAQKAKWKAFAAAHGKGQ